MKRMAIFLVLVLIVGVIGISGCTSSNDNQTTPSYTNNTNTTTQAPTTSNDTKSSNVDNSSSSPITTSSSSSSSDTGTFVGSVNSDVYHYPGCSAAKRIHSENLITFNSVTKAKNMGYRPCEICNPPG